MKSVKKAIVLCLIAICFMIPFVWSAIEFMALKPDAVVPVQTVPEDSVWVKEKGVFIGSDYIYDSLRNVFVDKNTLMTYTLEELASDNDCFSEQIQRSNDPLLKGLAKWKQHPNFTAPSASAKYDPLKDKNFVRNICNLGISYTPRMLYYTKHIYTMADADALQAAIDSILCREYLTDDLKDFDWDLKLVQDIKSIPAKVASKDIDDLGLLVLPYLIEQLDSENSELAVELLEDVAKNVKDDIFTNYADKNAGWWIRWSENNTTVIESISEFIKLSDKICTEN